MYKTDAGSSKFWGLFKRKEDQEKELGKLGKYEKVVDAENQALEGRRDSTLPANLRQTLSKPALRAFEFSGAYAECYDRCASNALRATLKNSSLESLLPDEVAPGASKDLLTVQDNPAEKSLKELVGQVLDQNLFEPPRPSPEHFVKQKLDKRLRETVRAGELKCEVHCAKKFIDALK